MSIILYWPVNVNVIKTSGEKKKVLLQCAHLAQVNLHLIYSPGHLQTQRQKKTTTIRGILKLFWGLLLSQHVTTTLDVGFYCDLSLVYRHPSGWFTVLLICAPVWCQETASHCRQGSAGLSSKSNKPVFLLLQRVETKTLIYWISGNSAGQFPLSVTLECTSRAPGGSRPTRLGRSN